MRAEFPTVFVSCFDKDGGDEEKGSFWKKVVDPAEIDEIEKRKTIMQGLLNRNKIEPGKESFFVLKQGLILYRSSPESNDILGISKLTFQKIEVFQTSIGTEKVYGIRLYCGMMQTKLLSLNKDVILEWFSKLSPMLVNREFFSKYELKEMLGEGAFSQVYKVTQKKTGESFAAKVIKHKMIYSDKRGVLLMKQEIEIMRQLDHPNIVKLIEVHEVNNAVILILEHVKGSELKKVNMQLSFSEVMVILKSLLSAIAYLESLGIVHRDLKPSNIMICRQNPTEELTKNSTKILDFGLAAFLSEKLILTKCGTPGYIAPEILNQSSRDKVMVNPNVDVYSIGIILYEMIYKCNPFKDSVGRNDSKKVVRKNAHSFIDYSKPTLYKAELDIRVVDLIQAMAHRDDRERPLASALIQHPIVMKGSILWKTPDYHPQIDENVVNKLLGSAYSFKVNMSKFSQDSLKDAKKKWESKKLKPLMLDVENLECLHSQKSDDFSPSKAVLSPINNRFKYKGPPTIGDKSSRDGSAMSLEKRFKKGMKRSDSPLMPTNEGDSPLNSSRNSFRTSSVGKANVKGHLISTKKNTGYEMQSTLAGGFFHLQPCGNKDDSPSFLTNK